MASVQKPSIFHHKSNDFFTFAQIFAQLFAKNAIFAAQNRVFIMTITELKQRYTLHPNVSGALHLLADDQVQHLYLSGLNGSAAPLFASTLMGQIKAPMLFVLGDVEEAGYFYHDLSLIHI